MHVKPNFRLTASLPVTGPVSWSKSFCVAPTFSLDPLPATIITAACTTWTTGLYPKASPPSSILTRPPLLRTEIALAPSSKTVVTVSPLVTCQRSSRTAIETVLVYLLKICSLFSYYHFVVQFKFAHSLLCDHQSLA